MATITLSDKTIIQESGRYAAVLVNGTATTSSREINDGLEITIRVELEYRVTKTLASSWLIKAGVRIGSLDYVDDRRTLITYGSNWKEGNKIKETWTRTFTQPSNKVNTTLDINTYTYSNSNDPKRPEDHYENTTGVTWSIYLPIQANMVNTFTLTPTTVETGKAFIAKIEATRGLNNKIENFIIKQGDTIIDIGSNSASLSTNRKINYSKTLYAPLKAEKYTYSGYVSSPTVQESVGKSATLTVKDIVPTISSASISPDIIPYDTTRAIYVRGETNTGEISVYVNDVFQKKGSSPLTITASAGDIIKVYGYNSLNDSISKSFKSFNVRGFTPISVTLNITPNILKDNLTTPDLVNIINGNANTNVNGSISWHYREGSSSNALGSWKDLQVSGTSFSNLDMTTLVNRGNFFQIQVIATGQYDDIDSDTSEIYRVPTVPGEVTFKKDKIIPKADPSILPTIIPDSSGKIFYGSGMFAVWNNPPENDSRLPLNKVEFVYASRPQGTSTWSDWIPVTVRFHKIQDDPNIYTVSTEDGVLCGGGGYFEVDSLFETKIGVRITDSLDQSTITEYIGTDSKPVLYYKAQSPTFGTSSSVLGISSTSLRPFYLEKSSDLIFNSPIGESAAQDKLHYVLYGRVNERDYEFYLLEHDISTQTLKDAPSETLIETINDSDNQLKCQIKKGRTGNSIDFVFNKDYLKKLFLNSLELSVDELGLAYNNNYSEVYYKIKVVDNFDAASKSISSPKTSINYIESPKLEGQITLGINKNLGSLNPYLDNSIKELNNTSQQLDVDRIVNPGEALTFKFKQAYDLNGNDYKTIQLGDVTSYNLYVCRLDEKPQSAQYENYDYIFLKNYPIKDLTIINADNRERYLTYPIISYQQSKFVIFKLEAVDSFNNTSNPIYSNTYAVPCRATEMDFLISDVMIIKDTESNWATNFTLRTSDIGGAYFLNNAVGRDYNNFPNLERPSYIVGNSAHQLSFNPKAILIFEGTLNNNFEDKGLVTLSSNRDGAKATTQYHNYYSETFNIRDLMKAQGATNYKEYFEESNRRIELKNFPQEWLTGIDLNENDPNRIGQIFFRANIVITYGIKNSAGTTDIDKFLTTNSFSPGYSFYQDSPTVSYRSHQIGINTKDFSKHSIDSGKREVLIIQDNGSYNMVVFKGLNRTIELSLTERTMKATTSNGKVFNINFDKGIIDGATLDGGSW